MDVRHSPFAASSSQGQSGHYLYHTCHSPWPLSLCWEDRFLQQPALRKPCNFNHFARAVLFHVLCFSSHQQQFNVDKVSIERAQMCLSVSLSVNCALFIVEPLVHALAYRKLETDRSIIATASREPPSILHTFSPPSRPLLRSRRSISSKEKQVSLSFILSTSFSNASRESQQCHL